MIEMKCNKNENKTQKVWIKESKNCIYKLTIIFAFFFKKIHKLTKAIRLSLKSVHNFIQVSTAYHFIFIIK